MTKLRVYTDGSCLKSGTGCSGFIVISDCEDDRKELHQSTTIHSDTTSNRMELQAMIDAMECIHREDYSKNDYSIEFCSDSSYVIKGINQDWYNTWKENGFKKQNGDPVKNIDLWENLENLVDEMYSQFKRPRFVWVRGKDSKGNGNGDIYNERIDNIVYTELKEYERKFENG